MDCYLPLLLIFWLSIARGENDRFTNSSEDAESKSAHNPNIVTIDLRQCFCSLKETCDLTIIKSSLKEANCEGEEQLCCPMIKSQPDSSLDGSKEEERSNQLKSTGKNNVRIFSIYATSFKNNTGKLTPSMSGTKSKKNCSCKSRGTCPHKYIDYGFGFHCSYSTVRCCVPDDSEVDESEKVTSSETKDNNSTVDLSASDKLENKESIESNETKSEPSEVNHKPSIDQDDKSSNEAETKNDDLRDDKSESLIDDLKPEGELLITEVTKWDEDDLFDRDSDCYCLSMEKCMMATKYDINMNTIERRRDTLCPGDLIQCCGKDVVEQITKKKDDTEQDITHIKTDSPPYQQPIQLPGTTNFTTPYDVELNNFTPAKDATIPPPVLPTQYHSYEPVSYQRGNVYTPSSYPAQLSGPLSYQKGVYNTNGQNIRPWVNLASPSSYSNNPNVRKNQYTQGYPRGPYPDDGSSRSTKPGGLFDTLAQMLG